MDQAEKDLYELCTIARADTIILRFARTPGDTNVAFSARYVADGEEFDFDKKLPDAIAMRVLASGYLTLQEKKVEMLCLRFDRKKHFVDMLDPSEDEFLLLMHESLKKQKVLPPKKGQIGPHYAKLSI